MSSSIVIIIGYLLGSIPFGYLITKLSTGKNVLKVGWRKTSGSNVFRNIGFWQGLLTGIFDVGKGSLAVWLAQNSGLSLQTQALAGVAAVTGHNYSCFLKLAGGRGIGTFIGAFLILSPKILGFSIIPLAFLALIWNASIGTILFLLTALILTAVFNQFQILTFVLISLFPIFIKRLSPIGELSLNPLKFSEKFGRVKKKELIRNRLIFDNDEFCLDLRIKRIIKRLTKKQTLDKL